MRDHVIKNPMMVVPRKQLPEVSGVFKSENCAFEMFLSPVRPTPNFKRDLNRAIKERWRAPISNIKLPELASDSRATFNPSKYPDVGQSEALRFDAKNKIIHTLFDESESEADLDRALRNIRQLLVTKNLKLKSISVQMIDQIYLFDTLNDFASKTNL